MNKQEEYYGYLLEEKRQQKRARKILAGVMAVVLTVSLVWFFGYFIPLQQQAQAQQQANRNAQILQTFHSCLSDNGYPTGYADRDNFIVYSCQQQSGCPYLGGYNYNGDSSPDDACMKGT